MTVSQLLAGNESIYVPATAEYPAGRQRDGMFSDLPFASAEGIGENAIDDLVPDRSTSARPTR